MDLLEAMKERHSVRSYTDREIEGTVLTELQDEIKNCCEESGLHIQLVTREPKAFSGMMAHYGKFRNARNYIAMVGQKSVKLDETIGCYGQRIVLKAQQLGLNTCWVALSFSKGKSRCTIEKGEKLVCVISIGYGAEGGTAHRSKPLAALCSVDGAMPDWFRNGMEAALLAPTAVNQQKFHFSLSGNTVDARATGGFYSKIDLGIVKYQFEIAAGNQNFQWAQTEI